MNIVERLAHLKPADFERYVDKTVADVTPDSAQVYRRTFDLWREWAEENSHELFDLRINGVLKFLEEISSSLPTRQHHLSVLRKFASIWREADPKGIPDINHEYMWARVKALPANDADQKVLTAAEVNAVFTVWDNKPDAMSVRNFALIWLLFSTGLRRTEVIGLRWEQIDFERRLIRRLRQHYTQEDVHMSGYAFEALLAWRAINSHEHVFVNCRFNDVKPDPITANALYKIVRETGKQAGVELSPEVIRRTLQSIQKQLRKSVPKEQKVKPRNAMLYQLIHEKPLTYENTIISVEGITKEGLSHSGLKAIEYVKPDTVVLVIGKVLQALDEILLIATLSLKLYNQHPNVIIRYELDEQQ